MIDWTHFVPIFQSADGECALELNPVILSKQNDEICTWSHFPHPGRPDVHQTENKTVAARCCKFTPCHRGTIVSVFTLVRLKQPGSFALTCWGVRPAFSDAVSLAGQMRAFVEVAIVDLLEEGVEDVAQWGGGQKFSGKFTQQIKGDARGEVAEPEICHWTRVLNKS